MSGKNSSIQSNYVQTIQAPRGRLGNDLSNNPVIMTLVHKLPVELLIHIFSYPVQDFRYWREYPNFHRYRLVLCAVCSHRTIYCQTLGCHIR
ncbi:hypothetical protein DL93DRAFT_2073734 [Clavulina sp. PMI_390]|nr:hypothetical protein DL93DRAFT_2073734 [Clavulina sp. PMI_390]